jgi:hypothetical protein
MEFQPRATRFGNHVKQHVLLTNHLTHDHPSTVCTNINSVTLTPQKFADNISFNTLTPVFTFVYWRFVFSGLHYPIKVWQQHAKILFFFDNAN